MPLLLLDFHRSSDRVSSHAREDFLSSRKLAIIDYVYGWSDRSRNGALLMDGLETAVFWSAASLVLLLSLAFYTYEKLGKGNIKIGNGLRSEAVVAAESAKISSPLDMEQTQFEEAAVSPPSALATPAQVVTQLPTPDSIPALITQPQVLGAAKLVPPPQIAPERTPAPQAMARPAPRVIHDVVPPEPQAYTYTKRDHLMTKSERYFYRRLQHVLGQFYHIFPQLSLAAVLDHSAPGQDWRAALARIQRKSVDYVICSTDLQILAAITLDDPSHHRPERQERDDFVDQVFADVGLPLIHISDIHTITDEQIHQQVVGAITQAPAAVDIHPN